MWDAAQFDVLGATRATFGEVAPGARETLEFMQEDGQLRRKQALLGIQVIVLVGNSLRNRPHRRSHFSKP